MWPAPFVGRADQDIRVDRVDVDRLVRGIVHRVDPRQRAHRMGELADPCGIDNGTDSIGRPRERHNARAGRQLALKIVEVQRRVIVQLDVLDDEALVMGELEPWGDAPVMVERGHENLVAGREFPACRARQHEVQRGHVRPEDHLVRLAAQERSSTALGAFEDLLDAQARRVDRAEVRARLSQRRGDGITDLVGDLRASRRVEECEPARQR